jgi:serine/threonine-protein kinase ULK/ATG1
VLKLLKHQFHECLNACKSLDTKSISKQVEKCDLQGITADRIIYKHAIDMSQSAALEELFGHPDEVSHLLLLSAHVTNDHMCLQCFRRYQMAQILLHSLTQQTNSAEDRELLIKYKEAVERRLFVLQGQGFVYAFANSGDH